MKKFLHPDLLKNCNFGGHRESEEKFFARIDRETAAVELLRREGYSVCEAWFFVQVQRGSVN